MGTRNLTTFLIAAMLGSGAAADDGTARPRAQPGEILELKATAYCRDGTTKSGTRTKTGIVAADPLVLPVGSVVRIDGARKAPPGIYTVMDTGRAVKGRHIDIFIRDCAMAQRFGAQAVRVHVLRRGWNPKASAPGR